MAQPHRIGYWACAILFVFALTEAAQAAVPPRSAAKPAASTTAAADWPRFRGPNCDGICPETGLVSQWPEGGPKLVFQAGGFGKGYSSVTIVGGRLYTMGDLRQGGRELQCVIAFDLNTRRIAWTLPIGPPHSDGPRCTPTVDQNMVYAIGTDGDLVCLQAATGRGVWTKNLQRDFGGQMMSGWRYSESPLIDGDRLVCTPGGNQAALVALNKKTGQPIWRCALGNVGDRGKDGAGYSSMVAADIDGIRQYVQILGRGAVGVAADDGRLLWSYNRIANNVANIPTPIVRGQHVFVTTSYKTGSALLKLSRQGRGMNVEEVWFNSPREFENHHGGVVLVGDYLYGGDGQNRGVPVCMELLTGKIKWKTDAVGRGSAAVLYADGKLIFRYEDGKVALIKADPESFQLLGQFTPAVVEGKAWAHPVIHEGKLYLRAEDTLMCYDVQSK